MFTLSYICVLIIYRASVMFQLIMWVIELNTLCCLAIKKSNLVRGDILILASKKPFSPKGGLGSEGGRTLVFRTSLGLWVP